MKTLIIVLLLSFTVAVGNAQEVIKLKEARVVSSPEFSKISGNNFSINVVESYEGEFETDPLTFMDTHLDINMFIDAVKDQKYDSFNVTFKSTKGDLKARFDNKGKLTQTSFKLKNVLIPSNLRTQLYRDHKGWDMVENMHVSKGKNGVVTKDYYHIKMERGNETRKFRIDVANPQDIEVAGY